MGKKSVFLGISYGAASKLNNVVGNFKSEYHSHPQDSLCEVL